MKLVFAGPVRLARTKDSYQIANIKLNFAGDGDAPDSSLVIGMYVCGHVMCGFGFGLSRLLSQFKSTWKCN